MSSLSPIRAVPSPRGRWLAVALILGILALGALALSGLGNRETVPLPIEPAAVVPCGTNLGSAFPATDPRCD